MSRKPQFESELDDELQFHLELQTEEFVRQGLTPDDARREAQRQFGGVEQIKEQVRDTRRLVWLSDALRDARLGIRMLQRSPGFVVTVALILGIAIGLATTIFSFVRAILLEPLPYPQADRLVVIRSVNPERELQLFGVSWPDLQDWRNQATSFDGIAAFRHLTCDLTDGQSTQRIHGMSTTRDFFEVVDVPLAFGRTFNADEEGTKSGKLVLGHDLWLHRFRGDPDIVGRTQDVYSWARYPETGPFAWEIVGIAGIDIPFLPTDTNVVRESPGINERVEFWQPPWVFNKDDRTARYEWTAVARLKPGVTIEQAASEMRLISKRLADEHPESNRNWSAEVVPLEELVTSEIRPALWLLCGAVGFLLLIACANVSGLLVVRGIARQQELAVRIALGAGRWRLIRQLITESLLLCLAGGAAGILLSFWSVDVVRAFAPPDVPRLQTVRIDVLVLAFALGLSVLTGVLVGGLPALLGSAFDLNETLKSGGRSVSAAKSRRRMMGGLVIGEVAVCLVLLTGAGLLIRSFASVLAVDPGFRTDQMLTMTVSLPSAKYEWKHNTEFCVELVTKLRELPGVESASAIRGVPTRETHFDSNLYFADRPPVPKHELPQAVARVIEPGFFETMEVPLLEGRLFEPADSIGRIGYSRVTVCNETFAKRFFPGESALGKRFSVTGSDENMMEIVGVAGDVRFSGLTRQPNAEFYYPEALFPQTEFTLLIRTAGEPQSLLGTVEKLVREAEPDVVITAPQSMDEVVSESLSRERFLMLLLSVFSLGALVLSVTGHYGVMVWSVSQRRREIGIRSALGATTAQIVWQIAGEGLLLTMTGLAIGAALSLAGARWIESELYGIAATDPVNLATAVLVLLLASLLAVTIPAIRGARVHPAEVLRSE
ncbi:FtsX-like permease family protein [bacterium]|nr:FtsX-like permease family protein [bacterium]